MTSPDVFYRENLYPLQDGILKLVRELKAPLYLTGGTALSRGYFDHRNSDDLDFFTNADPDFTRWVDLVIGRIEQAHQEGELTIDFANDSAPHFGQLVMHPVLGQVDALRNILSNKIAATLRFAGKDMSDLWIICRNRSFNWRAIWEEARQKEAGLDPTTVAEVVSAVPLIELESVRWRDAQVDCEKVRGELQKIAFDIVHGNVNSFGIGKPPLEK